MKIEHKESVWDCCKKGNRNTGNVNHYWRAAHKSARRAWKSDLFRQDYEALVKRI